MALDHTDIDFETATDFLIGLSSNRPAIPLTTKKQASPNAAAPKVGVYLSHFTATGPHWMPQTYEYNKRQIEQFVKMFDEYNFDVYAVVEPGTELLGKLPTLLAEMGLSEKVISIMDKPGMLELDVVFNYFHCNMREKEVQALLDYVKSGVGLLSILGTGMVSPGSSHEPLQELEGFEKMTYARFGQGELNFKVVNEHPILKGFKKGMPFSVPKYNGHYDPSGDAPVGATVLIDSVEDNRIPFTPMYVRDLGKGRIVKCAWMNARVYDWPYPLGEFYARCVNWAAHEDVDTEW